MNTTVHGLGERAGNAALEEVVMGLRHLHQLDCGVAMNRYDRVSELVSNASGRVVDWQKSLVGPGVFTHESGIHVDGLLKDRMPAARAASISSRDTFAVSAMIGSASNSVCCRNLRVAV